MVVLLVCHIVYERISRQSHGGWQQCSVVVGMVGTMELRSGLVIVMAWGVNSSGIECFLVIHALLGGDCGKISVVCCDEKRPPRSRKSVLANELEFLY